MTPRTIEKPLSEAEDLGMQLAIERGLCAPKWYSRATWPGDFTPSGGDAEKVRQAALRRCREFLSAVRRVADLSRGGIRKIAIRMAESAAAELQEKLFEGCRS